jgi:hypothetical protein
MQPRLILDDVYEALTELVQAVGGWKTVGHSLRPDLAPDRAGEWLRAALDPARREVLQLTQLVALLKMGREHHHHGAINWLLRELSYQPTEPVAREDEAALVRRELAVAIREQNRLLQQLALLESGR